MARRLTVISAGCGVGKTFSAVMVAAERARAGLRTAITTPTHRIARDYESLLREAGVSTIYRMAPHRMGDIERSDSGREVLIPYCQFVPQAELLSSGGLSVRTELCDGLAGEGIGGRTRAPCPYRDNCPAAEGQRVTGKNPLVWIGPHSLVHEAVEFIGSSGLLVIDEPPEPIAIHRLGSTDYDDARYAAELLRGEGTLEKFIDAIDNGVRAGTSGNARAIFEAGAAAMPVPNVESIVSALEGFGLGGKGTMEERIRVALAEAMEHGRMRLTSPGLRRVRGKQAKAALANGARMLAVLIRAVTETGPTAPMSGIVEVEGTAELTVIEQNNHLRAALMRVIHGSPTVLLDATVDVKLLRAFLAKFVEDDLTALNVEIDVVAANVEDGAPIERTWFLCGSATSCVISSVCGSGAVSWGG